MSDFYFRFAQFTTLNGLDPYPPTHFQQSAVKHANMSMDCYPYLRDNA